MSMNYYGTFMEVADDCPAGSAQVPVAKDGHKTKPVLEYDMIVKSPYKYTAEDVAFEVYAAMHDVSKADFAREREVFLGKSQPCLRASALGKRYGWGMHYDADGRIALVAVESPEYQAFVADSNIVKTKAFRSKRA